jgi:hypothetical protein
MLAAVSPALLVSVTTLNVTRKIKNTNDLHSILQISRRINKKDTQKAIMAKLTPFIYLYPIRVGISILAHS